MGNYRDFLSSVEKNANLSIDEIQSHDNIELRDLLEKRKGLKFRYTSHFPIIGRGNILRSRYQTSQEINRRIDKLLGI